MKKKNNYKVTLIILIIITIILFSFIIYLLFFKKPSNNKVLDNKKDEETINIDNNIEDDVDNEEDDNINLFESQEYYIENNLDRYIAYQTLNPSKNIDEVITDVNCNIDRSFYTDPVASNLDDGTLLIVNKYHSLSSDYVPSLVTMEDGYTNVKGAKMQPEAYEHYKQMVDDAKLEGITLYNVSAYRSYSLQNTLYTNYIKRDGVDAADRYSARPGYSEHQTGLASDINTASSKDHFENSLEYSWLNSNSYKYGFILRYPENKEYLTGYKFEPWHYRYVGVDVATYIYEHNITFDEYYAYFIENN